MSLLKECQRLLDFPPHRESLTVAEAHKKLSHTYMYINGRMSYIDNIDGAGSISLITDSGDNTVLTNSEVNSMELFTPEIGIYTVNGRSFFLSKKATRQWRKGFCQDAYVIKGLGEGVVFSVANIAFNIKNKSPSSMVLYKDRVYYLSLMVAALKEDNLELHEESFRDEVIDFMEREFTGHKFVEDKYVTDIQ